MSEASWRTSWAAVIGITAAAALALFWLGRTPLCECGVVRLWTGQIMSNENSQQFSDPYTFTHFIHGAVFYAMMWMFFPNLHVSTRLVLAVGLEAGWEVLENTNYIIDRYRETTVSLDYYGDSILNSVTDIAAMIAGFFLAWRLPVRVTAAAMIALDLALLILVRDSLAINIIMLIYPLEVIRQWQMQ